MNFKRAQYTSVISNMILIGKVTGEKNHIYLEVSRKSFLSAWNLSRTFLLKRFDRREKRTF